MPLAVIHADEMSKDIGGRRSEERYRNRLGHRTHSAKVVGQDGSDGGGARRHPEPEPVVVIERLVGYETRVIAIGIRVGYRRDRVLRKYHLISSKSSGQWAAGNG